MNELERQTGRNGAIDFLKLIFAILVMLKHSGCFNFDNTKIIFLGGHIGVEFFFLVSGYMMMSSYKRKNHNMSIALDTFNYVKGKFCRFIVEMLLAEIVFYIVVNYNTLHFKTFFDDFTLDYVWKILMLQCAGICKTTDITWYISALLLSYLILYPLIRKFEENFNLLAIIGFIFGMGYICQCCGQISTSSYIVAIIRASSGLLGGCICYSVASCLRKISFTKLFNGVLTVIEWSLYLFVIVYSYKNGHTTIDFFFVLLLLIAVTITASEMSYSVKILRGGIFNWLGELSLFIYLGHFEWTVILANMEMDLKRKMLLYVILSFVTGLFLMYVSKGIRLIWKKNKDRIKRVIINN